MENRIPIFKLICTLSLIFCFVLLIASCSKEKCFTCTESITGSSEEVCEDDTFNFIDLNEFAPGKQLTVELVHKNGSVNTIKLNHSYNQGQIDWFNEGSALNLIKKENAVN